MEQPLGEALVGLLGLALLGAGLYQAYQGLAGRFCARLLMERMNVLSRWACMVGGSVGHLARVVVFGTIGVFLLRAALAANPEKARGIGGALESLLEHALGPWLLLAVAGGLVLYGLYAFLEGFYQRVSPPP